MSYIFKGQAANAEQVESAVNNNVQLDQSVPSRLEALTKIVESQTAVIDAQKDLPKLVVDMKAR